LCAPVFDDQAHTHSGGKVDEISAGLEGGMTCVS
jgi:hypothetical protein